MPATVFISYSSNDQDEVVKLADKLRSTGVSIWVDESGIGAIGEKEAQGGCAKSAESDELTMNLSLFLFRLRQHCVPTSKSRKPILEIQ